jgi:hypothetical protein
MPRKSKARVRGKPFEKGDVRAGRPKGTPNKITIEAKELARELVENPAYRSRLKARLLKGKLAPAMETMLWHYAYGKPKETHEVTGPDGGPIEFERIERVIVRPKGGA